MRAIKPSKNEIREALRHFSTPELMALKQEIKNQLAGNVHYSATSEIKRSPTSFLLMDTTRTPDRLMRILDDRGQLMPEEKANMKESQPLREMRGFFAPRRF